MFKFVFGLVFLFKAFPSIAWGGVEDIVAEITQNVAAPNPVATLSQATCTQIGHLAEEVSLFNALQYCGDRAGFPAHLPPHFSQTAIRNRSAMAQILSPLRPQSSPIAPGADALAALRTHQIMAQLKAVHHCATQGARSTTSAINNFSWEGFDSEYYQAVRLPGHSAAALQVVERAWTELNNALRFPESAEHMAEGLRRLGAGSPRPHELLFRVSDLSRFAAENPAFHLPPLSDADHIAAGCRALLFQEIATIAGDLRATRMRTTGHSTRSSGVPPELAVGQSTRWSVRAVPRSAPVSATDAAAAAAGASTVRIGLGMIPGIGRAAAAVVR